MRSCRCRPGTRHPPARALLLGLLALALVLAAALATRAAPDQAEIERLVRQLGSDRFADREKAGERLRDIGEPALPLLRKAADGDADPEVRRRAAELVRALEPASSVVEHSSAFTAVAVSPDGKTLATADADGALLFWDATTPATPRTTDLSPTGDYCVAFAPDGKAVLAGGGDPFGKRVVVTLFSAPGPDSHPVHLNVCQGHTAEVLAVAFTPDGRRGLSGSADRTVRLWDLGAGKEVRCFKGHTLSVRDVACSPDGKRVLSAGADRTVRLWDLESGKELRRFEGHDGAVNGVAFSPDGKQALSCGADGTVRLWDLATGKEVRRFAGHTREVRRALFSPDGRRVLSAGRDRTVRLFDAATGKQLRSFTGHTDAVEGLAFFPDGRRAASAGADRTLRVWTLPR